MGDQTRFWTKWRTRFRWCRICVWLVILALVCAIGYLDVVGLPDFVKRQVVGALRQRGLVLQFVRLRLIPWEGLVADNVSLGVEKPDSPSLTVQQVKLQIDYGALLHRRLQLDGVILHHGKFEFPVSASNEPPCTLVVDQIQTELRLETNDVWALDNFQANFAGAKFVLSGEVSHASAVANWGIFHGQRKLPGATQEQLKKIGIALSQIHFNKASQLSLNVKGDASNINSFYGFLAVNAPGVDTPWGSMRNFTLVTHSAGSLNTIQIAGTNTPPPLEIDWKAQVAGLKTDMADIDYGYCAGSWRATGEIEGQLRLARLKSEKLNADFVSCDGLWNAPEIEITNLYARLGGGQLYATARLNLETREFSFTDSSCFDPQAISALLTDKARERLDQFTFPRPPALVASGLMILPAWTNRSPDVLRVEVQPTIRIQGNLAITNVLISGFSVGEVHAPFSYSNENWIISGADISQPDGQIHISGTESDVTKDYQWLLQGAISPNIIQPFLTTTKAARGFDFFSFAQPLFLDARIRGRLYDYDSINAEGHAALTNFSIRGEPVDNVETDFRYAHLVAEFLHPHLQAGPQTMKADGVRLDWPGDRIYFTNGLGTAYPLEVATAIGPIPEQILKPYHFSQPPTAIVNGYAPLRDPTNADLDFKIVGTASLECLRARTPAISGEIHWFGTAVILTNLSASLYGGRGHANIAFDFPMHKKGGTFSFSANVENVNLHSFALDLSSPSNHLEHLDGAVNGRFTLTSGNTEDWRSCNGYGDIDLRNGVLWDVPVFGMVSSGLNVISPGLGNSRATDATAQFMMTNGVLSTDNLHIRSTAMVLDGNGTLNLHGAMNAYFTADLLREVPVIGPFLGVITLPVGKVFECKVTGTWQNPKIRPSYPPTKLLFYMVHPIHSLKDMFPNDKPASPPKQ